MSELIKLEDEDSNPDAIGQDPLTQTRRELGEICDTLRTIRSRFAIGEDIRHYIGEALDCLNEAYYAARVKDPDQQHRDCSEPGAVVAHSTGELPGRFNP